MDRIISDEERIRRAEDIIERRRNTDLRISSDNFVKGKSKSRFKKMLIQCLICLTIYGFFYYTNISENIRNALNEDINLKDVYDTVIARFNEIKIFNNKDSQEQQNQEESENGNETNNKEINSENNEQGSDQGKEINEQSSQYMDNNEQNADNNQGEEISENIENTRDDEAALAVEENVGIGGEQDNFGENGVVSDENQMTIDANFVRNNMELMNPLDSGVVTSSFGEREATNIVSKNHRGIDIGAKTGTDIVASADGKVVEASSEGDFGVHLKVQNGDILMIYGHCSKLYVKAGDEVKKGQKIAEVGATGKATGPHLHFEVRRENRPINPSLIIDF